MCISRGFDFLLSLIRAMSSLSIGSLDIPPCGEVSETSAYTCIHYTDWQQGQQQCHLHQVLCYFLNSYSVYLPRALERWPWLSCFCLSPKCWAILSLYFLASSLVNVLQNLSHSILLSPMSSSLSLYFFHWWCGDCNIFLLGLKHNEAQLKSMLNKAPSQNS